MTEEDIADWVRRRLAEAPERSEAWAEETLALYLAEPETQPLRAA